MRLPPIRSLMVASALFCTYFLWGATYIAIHFAIQSFPPYLMVGLRFLIAGGLLYVALRLLGSHNPSLAEWGSACLIGLLLPVLGNGTVTHVQLTVSSSLAALMVATSPIWMAIFSSLWGHHISKREWLGIAIGVLGIILLNMRGSLSGDATNSLLLMLAAASWSLGSVWGNHLPMAKGLMGSVSQMLCGGVIGLLFSAVRGESWPAHISMQSWLAMLYLIVFSSIITYSAFQWLLKNVRPLVASSNTLVNPVVAFLLGIWLAEDRVGSAEYTALTVIVLGVFIVLSAEKRTSN